MGRMLIVIPDDLERRLRKWIEKQYKGQVTGFLSFTVRDAIEQYLDEKEKGEKGNGRGTGGRPQAAREGAAKLRSQSDGWNR